MNDTVFGRFMEDTMKKKNAQADLTQDERNAQQAETQAEAQVEAQVEAAMAKERGDKKTRKVLNTVINAVLIVAIVIAVIATYVSFVSTSGNGVPNIFGLRLLSIQTDSMYDTILPGDLIVATGVDDVSTLRKGDIITYWTVINGERVLNTHRVVEIYDGGGYLIFETKGDANTVADPLTVHESAIVGKYQVRIPGVGKVFDYLQTSMGFLIVVVIPVFLFFLFHLVQFFRVLFEYQNVKNRIKYEQERGRTEDLIAAAQSSAAQTQALDRAAIEAELREKLRAELLASMAAEQAAEQAAREQAAAAAVETSAEEVSDGAASDPETSEQ
ncbi:MAG: signal peptidase I [Ruminococcaceae bacterium]|nr:signal peptidase I [Oscillospiraceae bacterium]